MQEDLFQADDKNNTVYTVEEIEQLNIDIPFHIDVPEPNKTKCEYCGKVLHYEGIVFNNSVVTIRSEPQRCTCKQAVEHWKKVDEEKRQREEAERIQQQKAALKNRIEESKISRRYKKCRLNNYCCDTEEQRKAVYIAKTYCEKFSENKLNGSGLYIEGTIGTGKTHLAASVCYEIMKQGYRTLFTTSNDLFLTIQSTYNNSKLQTDEIIREYKTVSLLVIDDLGKEKPTEWALSMLFNILNYRYNEMLPSIITTNYNEKELINRLTLNGDNTTIESIIDRLHQNTELITITGKSRR